MLIALLIATAVVVVLIGLLSVGHAVGKTRESPPQIVVDMHEGIEFCAQALPDDVTAVITYDHLRHALRLHLEWVQAHHYAPDSQDETPIVFEELDALDYFMERADITRLDISREHAARIIEAHSAYLQVMGAIHLEDPVTAQADLSEMPLLGTGEE